MPNNTPNGWPYILPTDNVADYPVTSLALATKADALPYAFAAYQFSMSVGTLASYDRIVNFPAGLFTQPPIVLVAKANGAAVKWSVSALSANAGNVTVRAQTVDASTGGASQTLIVALFAIQASSTSGSSGGVTALAQEIDWAAEEDPAALQALLDAMYAEEAARAEEEAEAAALLTP